MPTEYLLHVVQLYESETEWTPPDLTAEIRRLLSSDEFGSFRHLMAAASHGQVHVRHVVHGWYRATDAREAYSTVEEYLLEQFPELREAGVTRGNTVYVSGGDLRLTDYGDVPGLYTSGHFADVSWLAYQLGFLGFQLPFSLLRPEGNADLRIITSAFRSNPYDMSGHVRRPVAVPFFGQAGPLVNGFSMHHMGWLPEARIRRIELPGGMETRRLELALAPLGQPGVDGPLMLEIGGFRVEFRTRQGYDGSFPQPEALFVYYIGILEYMVPFPAPHTFPRVASVLLTQRPRIGQEELPGYGPGETYVNTDDPMTPLHSIEFTGMDPAGRAMVRINLGFPPLSPTLLPRFASRVLGGLKVDGGGFVVVNGRLVRTPPRGPWVGIVSRLAAFLAKKPEPEPEEPFIEDLPEEVFELPEPAKPRDGLIVRFLKWLGLVR